MATPVRITGEEIVERIAKHFYMEVNGGTGGPWEGLSELARMHWYRCVDVLFDETKTTTLALVKTCENDKNTLKSALIEAQTALRVCKTMMEKVGLNEGVRRVTEVESTMERALLVK